MKKITDKVCNFCLYNLRDDECTHKKINAKQECENFTFVITSNIPYKVVKELSNLDDIFYECAGEAMELIFNSILNSHFFIFIVDLNERMITILDRLNDIVYDEVSFSEITFGDNYISFESDNFDVFLSLLKVIDKDDMICQIKFNGLTFDNDYIYLGRGIDLEKKMFSRVKRFRISYERFPKNNIE